MDEFVLIPLNNSIVQNSNYNFINLESDCDNLTYTELDQRQSETSEKNVAEQPTNNPLYDILSEWNIREVYEYLKDREITVERLRYLTSDDLVKLIPSHKYGLMIEFREKIFCWKEANGYNTKADSTLTVTSKVIDWLKSQQSNSTESSVLSLESNRTTKAIDLHHILSLSDEGQYFLRIAQLRIKLTMAERTDLINFLVRYFYLKQVCLQKPEFKEISEQIVKLYPTENIDSFYKPGINGSRQSGFYFKYINNKHNTKKRTSLENQSQPRNEQPNTKKIKLPECDEIIGEKLRCWLQYNDSPWEEVVQKWKGAFQYRRNIILKNNQSNFDFLREWPLLKSTKGIQLINIDFSILYPDRAEKLFTKWQDFKIKIMGHYKAHIKDKQSLELLNQCENMDDNSNRDYLIMVLLNSVLLPTQRYSTDLKNTKKLRKYTIKQAEEEFVIHIKTVNNLKIQIEEFRGQCKTSGFTLQPLMIVIHALN